MVNFTQDEFERLRVLMKRHTGTFMGTFNIIPSIADPVSSTGTLFEIISGKHYFLVRKIENNILEFYHSSPGTGTRRSIIDLSLSPATDSFQLFLSWSPESIKLHFGPKGIEDGILQESIDCEPLVKFQVDENGSVVQLGVGILGARATTGGVLTLRPPAIETWQETLEAINVLLRGTSIDGFMFEVVKSNMIMVMLVTAFESYCKTRISEMEEEGVVLNYTELETRRAITRDEIFATTSNYFQNLGYAKNIWRYLADIRIAGLIPPSDWQYVTTMLFPFRHRVVHAHPLAPNMNGIGEIPAIFSTNETGRAIQCVSLLITELHKRSIM